ANRFCCCPQTLVRDYAPVTPSSNTRCGAVDAYGYLRRQLHTAAPPWRNGRVCDRSIRSPVGQGFHPALRATSLVLYRPPLISTRLESHRPSGRPTALVAQLDRARAF